MKNLIVFVVSILLFGCSWVKGDNNNVEDKRLSELKKEIKLDSLNFVYNNLKHKEYLESKQREIESIKREIEAIQIEIKRDEIDIVRMKQLIILEKESAKLKHIRIQQDYEIHHKKQKFIKIIEDYETKNLKR